MKKNTKTEINLGKILLPNKIRLSSHEEKLLSTWKYGRSALVLCKCKNTQKWNQMLGLSHFRTSSEVKWAWHSLRQWNGCVKHAPVFNWSSVELTTEQIRTHYLRTRTLTPWKLVEWRILVKISWCVNSLQGGKENSCLLMTVRLETALIMCECLPV